MSSPHTAGLEGGLSEEAMRVHISRQLLRGDKESSAPRMFEGAKHPLDDGTKLMQTIADSDHAGGETRRSTMVYVVTLNG